MKIRTIKKRVAEKEVRKPKRVDLNENQLALRRLIADLAVEEVVYLEGLIHKSLTGSLPSKALRRGVRFYDPNTLQEALGLSPDTAEKYTDGYLRLVRRDDESPEEFYLRKRKANREDAPLVDKTELMEAVSPKTYRLISSRVLLFLLLGPTSVRRVEGNPGKQKYAELRKQLSEVSFLKISRPLKIQSNSSVISWTVEK